MVCALCTVLIDSLKEVLVLVSVYIGGNQGTERVTFLQPHSCKWQHSDSGACCRPCLPQTSVIHPCPGRLRLTGPRKVNYDSLMRYLAPVMGGKGIKVIEVLEILA